MTTPLAHKPSAVTAADFPGVRWHGNWIWCDPPPLPSAEMIISHPSEVLPEAHALFRKVFVLTETRERVPARITADSRYLLFCNGQEVGRGPIRSQPRRMHYDLFDLAPYLRAGENLLAIYVKYYGRAKAFWMPAPGGLGTLHGPQMVCEANLGAEWLVTDASWKTLKSDAWAEDWRRGKAMRILDDVLPIEVFDARQFPWGWERPGFDDSGWSNSHQISFKGFAGPVPSQPPTNPYGPLYPRPIAQLGGEVRRAVSAGVQVLRGRPDLAEGDPVGRVAASFGLEIVGLPEPANTPANLTLSRETSARITLDMGRIVIGHVALTLNAPAGTIFDFSYTEEPLDPSKGFNGMHSGTRYYARGEHDSFQVYDALGFRYAHILVHGAEGLITLADFVVQEDIYPWQPGPSFRCSDEELNRIFDAGVRTVNLNARDAFTDCPTREQQAWVGDSVVHQMVTLATNSDWRLAWHYLTLSDSPRYDGILPPTVSGLVEGLNDITIPDWSLHWVHGVYNLYRFSGDREKVLRFMPSVARVLRWFAPFQNEHGILENIIEWALIDWSAVSVEGQSSIYTAIWARGLAEFAEIAGWLGEHASREWAEKLYAKARAGFEMFWDEARGSYIDHIVDGEQRPEMSQLAGALGILSGLAPQARWPQIITTITNPERVVIRTWAMPPQDDTGDFVMNRAHRFTWDVDRQIVRAEPFMSYVVHDAIAEAGLADMLPVLYRDWSRFLRDGYDTIGEDWMHGTHAHGWSCTPTRDLIFYTLGVTPAEAGYATARIAPRLGGLDWIEGHVPTPHGLIWVRAEPGTVEFDSPVPVLVELPGREPERLPAGRCKVT